MHYRNMIIVVSMLVSLVILQPSRVFATTYDSTWYVFQEGDPQKRRFAEIQVTYSFPDKVKAGRPFEVDVSLTYLKNDKAHINWLDFYEVTVHVRKSATGSNLATDADASRVRLEAGGRYTHKFTLTAPQELDEYFVILAWKTLNPVTSAYGLTINDDEITWDTGEGDAENLPKVTVGKAETVLVITFDNLQTATIKVDGRDVSVTDGTVQLPLEGEHTIEVPAQVELAEGTRTVFDKWSDGITTNLRRLSLENDLQLGAVYKKQYLLGFSSTQGNPQGDGWYDAGSQATISVTSPQPDALGALGGKLVFAGWTGDVTSDSPTTSVTMDGPKTVKPEWSSDDSQAYMILGGIVVAIAVMIAVLLLMRRRGRAVQETSVPLAEAPPSFTAPGPPAYPARPPLREGAKYCVHCGAVIPDVVLFCTKCGKKQ